MVENCIIYFEKTFKKKKIALDLDPDSRPTRSGSESKIFKSYGFGLEFKSNKKLGLNLDLARPNANPTQTYPYS